MTLRRRKAKEAIPDGLGVVIFVALLFGVLNRGLKLVLQTNEEFHEILRCQINILSDHFR